MFFSRNPTMLALLDIITPTNPTDANRNTRPRHGRSGSRMNVGYDFNDGSIDQKIWLAGATPAMYLASVRTKKQTSCELEADILEEYIMNRREIVDTPIEQYPVEEIERLKEVVRSKELSALDRMNLISDVASMAKADYCSATLILELAKASEAE
eukprot:972828_1